MTGHRRTRAVLGPPEDRERRRGHEEQRMALVMTVKTKLRTRHRSEWSRRTGRNPSGVKDKV